MIRIEASVTPELYTVENLLGIRQLGKYYREQLFKTKAPDYTKDYFEVEKILATKVFKKEKWYLCKFLYYENAFNQYIPAKYFKQTYR